MFEAKSGLRKIATIITVTAIASALSLGSLSGAASAASNSNLPKTVSFLKAAFSATDIETRMTSGFALEALIQLAGAGVTASELDDSIVTEFTDPRLVFGNKKRPGFLMDPTAFTLKPGLTGKFLFASKVLKAPNPVKQARLVASLDQIVKTDGGAAASQANAQDIAWVVLGLQAESDLGSARKAAAALMKLQLSDGGFNYDPTLTTGGTDVTAIAIQALKSLNFATKSSNTKRNSVVSKAVAFLKRTDVNNNHFEAWGDLDPNGTAYAIMGLQAAGQNVAAYASWLRSKVQSDGGIEAPWAVGAGDRYVTAQGYLPLVGKTYLTLLANL